MSTKGVDGNPFQCICGTGFHGVRCERKSCTVVGCSQAGLCVTPIDSKVVSLCVGVLADENSEVTIVTRDLRSNLFD